MSKHPEKCWSCASTDMQPVKGWYKCSDCGATTDSLTQPGHSAVIEVANAAAERQWTGHTTRYKPYGSKS